MKLKKFNDDTVLITGGSRGLGLALAKEYLAQGARVCLVARDSQELSAAKNLLDREYDPTKSHIFPLDITQPQQVLKAFTQITTEVGSISVLVNNAGSILVAPYDALTEEDFQAQMDLHLFAVIRLCKLIVDHFREHNTKGRIVNICSLGGKIAVPHMMSYDASKFALAGYSQALQSELAQEGISVTTVYPTVMRTGSTIQAVFKGDCEKEYQWFATSAHMPLLALKAQTVARQTVHASYLRKSELIPSFLAKLRLIAGVVAPDITAGAMALIAQFLPHDDCKNYKTGADSESQFKLGLFYKIFAKQIEMTQRELNQKPKSDAKFNLGILKKKNN